ncbi:unnamed protein product [Linum trigynum]|uniref:DUF3593 domain-containing protein n=1 Tax=Linum trigynum TaxID=586398 RepID=A0AAV2ELZ7_9ROSI
MNTTCCRRSQFEVAPTSPLPVSVVGSRFLLPIPHQEPWRTGTDSRYCREIKTTGGRGERVVCSGWLPPVDPWAPNIDSQSIAPQLFALSLFPYIAFLYFLTKSKTAPGLTLFGFYFLLAFVGATIPAGIYAKVQYGTSLSNVDWLHGGAESLLTLTNIFIVLGLRQALRNGKESEKKGYSGPGWSVKEGKKDV